ncbi:DUF4397 domain-containing protein [Chitinolyticbacter meiyuanensis]|uniref:DUF4397 domain-containing protein n=1 Tax=Chitinolyticbacter meiyuanensis TaxID=682798 RepID=UPI0011E58D0A|nr:DUF4397 domain-containing protein [Chitinolyticbacter meiyuanensis]
MKLVKLLLLGVISATLLSACGGGDDDDLDDRLDIADPKVRFVHAIPAGPNVTLYRNGAASADATNVGYKFASQYFDVSEGQSELSVKSTDGATSYGTVTFDAKRGDKYTAVALIGDNVTDVLLIEDPYNKELTSNDARVRVANAAFNAQNIDVYLTEPTVDINTVTPSFAAVGYKTANPASGNDSQSLEGGDYLLRITAAGSKTVIFQSPVTLAKNADWLLLPIPVDGIGALVPNSIKVLVAKSDDESKATIELTNTP